MKNSTLIKVLVINGIILIFIAYLFSINVKNIFNPNDQIDGNRFSQFGSFVAGIFGFVNFVILMYSYKEAKSQSLSNVIFSTFQIHDNITKDLKSNGNQITKLNEEYERLFHNYLCRDVVKKEFCDECYSYEKLERGTDYFEILYRILHVKYKYKEVTLENFFTEQNWRIGHYLRSVLSIIEILHESDIDFSKKAFYARILHARLSLDEMRIVFYYLIRSESFENNKILKLFDIYGFYKIISPWLIKPEEDEAIFKTMLRKSQ